MKNGTILLTRHDEEDENTTPGYWNHAAIISDTGTIIEALLEKGVVETPLQEWLDSVDIAIGLQYENMDKAAREARYFLGRKYRRIASVFKKLGQRRQRLGLNCVSVVRLCYFHANKKDPQWIVPDDIQKDLITYWVKFDEFKI